jgi:phosphoribosylformylglycinamidine synthase
MNARVGVVVFPGSNCEHDVAYAIEMMGATPALLWHDEALPKNLDAVVLPGGFAHGDYLRPGAIARFSPVMESVGEYAENGGAVVGICNGFQVLTEAGLVPGALQKNKRLEFLCMQVDVQVTSNRSVLSANLAKGTVLRLPINHFLGSYVCDEKTLQEITDNDQVILRYVDNPNGSLDDIAGVANRAGNVVGLMPHPERAVDALLGSKDGRALFSALLVSAKQAA